MKAEILKLLREADGYVSGQQRLLKRFGGVKELQSGR